MTATTLHPCLQRFPGAALELSASGIVRASNGHLEALVGRPLAGGSLAEIMEESSREKWRRILSSDERRNPPCAWELAFTTATSIETRSFLAIWRGEDDDADLWLLEQASDPKLESLYAEMSELHRELVEAQRKLQLEKRQLAQALERAEAAVRTRDEVLGVVSHDLRNPLSAIITAACVLQLDVSRETRDEQIDLIRRVATGMNRLIGDLLDVSAIDVGRLSVEAEPLSLGSVFEEVRRSLAAQAAEKGVKVEYGASEELPQACGDRYRLQQVLSNLVGNAIKFTPAGGTVAIRSEAAEKEVIIRVADTGPGILPAELPRIFDRFWHTSRPRGGGAGLGLAISKGIVEAHGGRIWAESIPGEGTTFCFSLPVARTTEP